MTGFIDELIDESFGASSKRWAMIVVALAVGAIGALWWWGPIRTRSATGEPPTPEPPAAPIGDLSTVATTAATQVASAWRKVSTPPPRLRTALTSRPVRNRRSRSTSTE